MILRPTRVAAAALQALPRKSISRALGGLTRVRSRGALLEGVIAAYCRAYGVDMSDFVVPDGGFETFDAFFTRRLKPGARPVEMDPNVLVAPADGRVEDAGTVTRDGRFVIKGSPYTLCELLGEELQDSERFYGGQFMVIYLSPRDYHRVHAPVAGPVVRCRHVDGTLYPVNRIGVEHVPQLFARNERVAIHQQTAQSGCVCTVMVGAVGVGRITISFESSLSTNAGIQWGLKMYSKHDAPVLDRGQELGIFHLGSTAILFLEPGPSWRLLKAVGHTVRMGEAVARQADA